MDKIQGKRPTALFIDEHSSLANVDFYKLEHLLVNQGYAVLRTSFDPENNTLDSEVFGMADMVMDDGSVVDFKTGFDPIVCGGGRYRHPQLDQIPRGTITGRIRKDDPQFHELPGVRELQDKAWGDLLHGALNGDVSFETFRKAFIDRYSGSPFTDYQKKPGLPAFETALTVGADHPSRKREPKGPRGKWGKL